MNWYNGLSTFNLPHQYESFKKYKLETASLNGSVSTPYFRNTFDENKFWLKIDWWLILLVPSNLTEGSNLVIDIQYDLALSFSSLNERVEIYWRSMKYDKIIDYQYFTSDTREELEKTKRTARRTYLASEYSDDGKKLV